MSKKKSRKSRKKKSHLAIQDAPIFAPTSSEAGLLASKQSSGPVGQQSKGPVVPNAQPTSSRETEDSIPKKWIWIGVGICGVVVLIVIIAVVAATASQGQQEEQKSTTSAGRPGSSGSSGGEGGGGSSGQEASKTTPPPIDPDLIFVVKAVYFRFAAFPDQYDGQIEVGFGFDSSGYVFNSELLFAPSRSR